MVISLLTDIMAMAKLGGLLESRKVEMNGKYTTAVNRVFNQVPNGGSCNDLLGRELSEIDH